MNQSRSAIMIGGDGVLKLQQASVAIIGLGGVGSFTVEAIARSGVGKVLVVDSDETEESNLNRQLFALNSSLGRPKAELAKERILDINPQCDVAAIQGFMDSSSNQEYLEYDIVIDCIDSFHPKLHLVKTLLQHKKTFISSMGAAGKLDVAAVRLAKLEKTTICPLARKMRKRMKRERYKLKFPVVYSIEYHPTKPLDGNQGSMVFVPAVFGITLANWACKKIIEG